MIISLKKWGNRLKYALLFLLFSYLMFRVWPVVQVWMEPSHRYQEPAGQSVKVFMQDAAEEGGMSVSERLRYFYWYGF